MRTSPLLADFIHARACKPICEKYLTLPISGSASQAGLHNGGVNERNEAQEKLLGILLAAAAALLCAAIDYFMKQEDDKP